MDRRFSEFKQTPELTFWRVKGNYYWKHKGNPSDTAETKSSEIDRKHI